MAEAKETPATDTEQKAGDMMEMLKAGVHFGHKKSKKHPRMDEFVFTVRGGISILDLSKTKLKLSEATDFVKKIAADGGVILFVGTKRQAGKIIKAAAERAEMPYVSERWLGGTFTNFEKILIGKKRLETLLEQKASGELAKKYTKKELGELDREMKRLEIKFGGIKQISKIPDAVFVVDMEEEATAIVEARRVGVPIVAITDTNVDPALADYPIPANDDAIRSIELITGAIADAVIAGRKK